MNETTDRLTNICLDPDEFLKDSAACKLHAEVMQDIREQRSRQFVDAQQVRDNQDWSFLADKVVGSELQLNA
jgi:hypothetical protein